MLYKSLVKTLQYGVCGLCALSASAVHITAAEEANDELVVSASLPDFSRTRERFESGVYGLIWNHAAMADARADVQRDSERQGRRGKPEMLKALRALQYVQFELLSTMTKEQVPVMHAQADIGDYAQVIWDSMTKKSEAILAPAGADAAIKEANSELTAARYGSTIVAATDGELSKLKQSSEQYDVGGELFINALFKLMEDYGQEDEEAMAMFKQAKEQVRTTHIKWHSTLLNHGIKDFAYMDFTEERIPGALDASLFNSLPKNTLMAGASFLHMAKFKEDLQKLDLSLDRNLQMIDMMLRQFGTNYVDLMSSLDGTVLFAVTPSVPFPAANIALPRSGEVDKLIQGMLKQFGVAAPEAGGKAMLPIPNLPVVVQIGVNDAHWIISSDAVTIEHLIAKTDGGFSTGPLAESAKKNCSKDTIFAGFYDTKALLNLALGFSAMLPVRDPQMRLTIADLIQKVQQEVGPGFLESHWVDGGIEINGEGIFGSGIALFPVIAAIAIPNLLESRITANEGAAGASMKSALFAAQVQFQAGGYHDQNANGIGRHGFINEMNGNIACLGAAKGDLGLLMGNFAKDEVPLLSNGYYFKVFLPNGDEKAFSSSAEIPKDPNLDETDMELKYVIYAWPQSAETGRRVFAMQQDGQLRSYIKPYDYSYDAENMPPWNWMFGEDGKWSDGASADWPFYSR